MDLIKTNPADKVINRICLFQTAMIKHFCNHFVQTLGGNQVTMHLMFKKGMLGYVENYVIHITHLM